MPVINRIAAFADEMKEWRHWMHRNPELQFECHKTAGFVVERLRDFGITDIHEGIATTGVVAIIEGTGSGPTIGLRADMDALPIIEATGLEHASETHGNMHACGHDGHTTMLLGAAKYLAETRNFSGRVAFIFQPAEEGGGGAGVMVDEGILERFDISQIYALHNAPGHTAGSFYTTPGPIMAAADTFEIRITGVGGHGAMPHETKDPIAAALAVGNAFQTSVSRNHYALEGLVVSITQIHSGTADNIVPADAYLCGTVRTFEKSVQAMVMRRMDTICRGLADAYDVDIQLDYQPGYPATVNHEAETIFAADVAREVAGDDQVTGNGGREMGAEDFSYMLEKCAGSYLFLGQGESAGLHHPEYDFNDDVATSGASFFARLVEKAQPIAAS
jgi:hippurate hydrolase